MNALGTRSLPDLRALTSRVIGPVAAAVVLVAIVAFVDLVDVGELVAGAMKRLWALAPIIVLSAGIASLLSAAGSEQLARWLGLGSPWAMIALASGIGALSPLCSCSVVPIVGALLAGGAPLSVVVAFWLSSPVMSSDTFLLIAGGVDLSFALAQTLAAAFLGLAGGALTVFATRLGAFRAPLRPSFQAAADPFGDEAGGLAFWRSPARLRGFLRSWGSIGVLLCKWLFLALLLEHLLLTLSPELPDGSLFTRDSGLAVPLAAAAGLPLFINGYAMVPLIAAMLEIGIDRGVLLAFAVSSAATSFPACVAVFGLVRSAVFGWYLMLAALLSGLAGWGYQAFGA